MKVTDFRIGNLVEDPKGNIHKIERLDESSKISNGIKLTDEWLIKFGFIKDDNGIYWIDLEVEYLELIPSLSKKHWLPRYVQIVGLESKVKLRRIKFVHQLQNLFFVITGKELEKND